MRGAKSARAAGAFLCRLHCLARHLELAAGVDGRAQAVGQTQGKWWGVGHVHDVSRHAGVKTDGQVKSGDGNALTFLGDILGSLGLGQRGLRPQNHLAHDDAGPGQFPGHLQVVLAAVDRFVRDTAQ